MKAEFYEKLPNFFDADKGRKRVEDRDPLSSTASCVKDEPCGPSCSQIEDGPVIWLAERHVATRLYSPRVTFLTG